MYLSRFGVKNYKCLGEIDIPLTPIHVLIGENDAGKTSLLEAMAAFYASSEKPLTDVFPRPWTGRELVNHASPNASIEFLGEWERSANEKPEGTEPPFHYGFAVDFPGEQTDCAPRDEWIQGGGEKRFLLTGAGQSACTTPVLQKLGRPVPRDASASDSLTIRFAMRPAHQYSFDAKLMAVPAAIATERRFRMDPDGFGLATLLLDIAGYDADLFGNLRRDLCHYFPQFKGLRVGSEEAALKRVYQSSGIHTSTRETGTGVSLETRSGQTLRAQQTSDGAILFLGFLALAHSPDPPTLLLIDEPENGIYPKRLGEVVKLLKEMVHRTEGVPFPQIIMSTHSPYVLSFFEPEEVTFLSRPPDEPNGPVRARPLRDAPNIRERMGGEFYLGELWYNLSEKELFGDP